MFLIIYAPSWFVFLLLLLLLLWNKLVWNVLTAVLKYVQGRFIIWFVKHWTGVSFPTFPSWEMYLTDITAQMTPVSADMSWQTKHILPAVHGRVTNQAATLPSQKKKKKKSYRHVDERRSDAYFVLVIAFTGWWVTHNREYLLGFPSKFSHGIYRFIFYFCIFRKKTYKGIPLDSNPHKIT